MSDVTKHVLTYAVTGLDVRIGDRVAKKPFWFFRGERLGRVIYVPGQCTPHPEMERDGMSYWAVRFDNGILAAWLYHPRVKAIRKFRLLQRGDTESGPKIGEKLLEDEDSEHNRQGKALLATSKLGENKC